MINTYLEILGLENPKYLAFTEKRFYRAIKEIYDFTEEDYYHKKDVKKIRKKRDPNRLKRVYKKANTPDTPESSEKLQDNMMCEKDDECLSGYCHDGVCEPYHI